jgi:superfamily I DNA and/or RNA helicase
METDLFNQDKILVCAPSNAAANNLADRLSKLPILKNKMARYFPTKRQDLFNLDKKQIHPHSVMQMIIDHLDQIYEGPNRFKRSIEDHVYNQIDDDSDETISTASVSQVDCEESKNDSN